MTENEQDVAAIRQIVADVEAGFNTNDADLMNRHFTENAAVVNAMGIRTVGREALLAASEAGLAGFLKDQYARYEVRDVTFLREDVALAHKEAYATTAEGADVEVGHAMNALYVLVKAAGRWQIAARQNTLVQR